VTGLLQYVHEYQTLVTRAERLHIPLDPAERWRLRTLARALGEGQGTGTRGMPRILCPLAVTLTLPGGFQSARLRDVSGTGMRVRMSTPPPAEGTTVLVHVAGALEGEEFTFPAEVVWRRGGDAPVVGLRFHGLPTRTSPMGMAEGRRRRYTPLVA
jgi:hypothetical protein